MKNVWLLLSIFFTLFKSTAQERISVYFNHDDYQLDSNNIARLDSIIAIKTHNTKVLNIKGFANAFGTKRYNKVLSLQRAQFVARYLKDRGATVDSIQGYGETSSFNTTSRRVEITFNEIDTIHKKDLLSVVTNREASIESLAVGEKMVFRNLNFVGGTDVPLFKSQAYLIELFQYLRDHPTVKVKFIGHICCHGNMDPKVDGINTRTNQRSLSRDRAKAVYDYMVHSGIAKERLSYEGRAYTEPLGKIPADDRRVEIELVAN